MKFYRNHLNNDLVKRTMGELLTTDYNKHTFYNVTSNSNHSYDDDLFITYNTSTSDEIMKRIWEGIYSYYQDMNFSWFSGWKGFSKVRFNKYPVGTNMKPHCDHIHSLFDGSIKGIPILSVLGSLNDDYEGGELIFFDNQKIVLNAGDIVIFPSNFLFPHAVKNVTKGTRYSFVSWVW